MMTAARDQTRKALASEPGWTPEQAQERLANAWEAVVLAAFDFEQRRKAVARDQLAALVSDYSARAATPSYGEDFLSHEQVGYLVATDERLMFWAGQLLAGS